MQRLLQIFRKAFVNALTALRYPALTWHITLTAYSAAVLATALSARDLFQIFSIPFLVFWPGYSIVAVGLRNISLIEEVVLSFGLSIGTFVGLVSAVRLFAPSQNGPVIAMSFLAFLCLLIFSAKASIDFKRA